MLTREENELLTQVDPGTPCGNLFRRYWHPVAAASDLTDERPKKRVKILGEELVLYRDGKGVSQDSIRAHMWFNLAENQGISSAKKKRIKLATTMTPLQIAAAKKMARYCEKKDYKKCE